MRTSPIVAAMIVALALLPGAGAQSMEEVLADIRFETLTFTVGWNAESEAGEVLVSAAGLRFEGDAASQFRACLDDNEEECPMEPLLQAANGDGDGQVDDGEVEDFVTLVQAGINTVPEFQGIRTTLRSLITVDETSATSGPTVSAIRLQDAQGSVSSTSPISLSLELMMKFGNAEPASTHTIVLERAESDLAIADRIIVRPGTGWKIQPGSVEPTSLQDLLSGGRIEGTQEEFEGTEPLSFTIEKSKAKSPSWGFAAALVCLFGVAFLRRKL